MFYDNMFLSRAWAQFSWSWVAVGTSRRGLRGLGAVSGALGPVLGDLGSVLGDLGSVLVSPAPSSGLVTNRRRNPCSTLTPPYST